MPWPCRRAGATEVEIVVYGAGGVCRGAGSRHLGRLALIWYAAAGPLATIAHPWIGLIVVAALRLPIAGIPRREPFFWLAGRRTGGDAGAETCCRCFKAGPMAVIYSRPMSTLLDEKRVPRRRWWHPGLCAIRGRAAGPPLQSSSVAAILCCTATIVPVRAIRRAVLPWRLDCARRPLDGANARRPDGTPAASLPFGKAII